MAALDVELKAAAAAAIGPKLPAAAAAAGIRGAAEAG
jgi:hypothetical protein